MNTELKEQKKMLLEYKQSIVDLIQANKDQYDGLYDDFAAADMALKEFERKHGGEE